MRWNLKPLAVWLAAIIIGVLLSFALVYWLELDEGPRVRPALGNADNP